MKQGWEIKKLGEVCDIKTGRRDANHGNPNGKYHFFTCAKEHSYIDDYNFDTEAILVAGNGDVGAVKYFKGKFDAYQRVYVLHNFKEIVDIRLLFLLLDGKLKDVVSKQKLGNTMPYIKLGMLQDFQIPLPPLPDQQRIVTILNKAFTAFATAKENAQQNLLNAKELFESYLQNVFENKGDVWEKKRLDEVCKITSKLIDPKE
jgi:type I restriction enzyme S subunit